MPIISAKKKLLFCISAVLIITGAIFLISKQSPQTNKTAKNTATIDTPLPAPEETFIPVNEPPITPPPVEANQKKTDEKKTVKKPKTIEPKITTQPVNTSQNGTVFKDCVEKNGNSFECFENHYRSLTRDQGIKAAFAELKEQYKTNSYIQAQCHPIAHIIGREAAIINESVSRAYSQGDSFCWSGYYHGVMEGAIKNIGRAEIPNTIKNICNDIPGKAQYTFDYYNCVHGLGHGVMAYNNNELFDALTLCDSLNGSWEQNSCYGGVFMENIIVDNKNHFTNYLKANEPIYPCNAVKDNYKQQCFLMQTSYMLKVTNSDFKKVFDLCETVGTFSTTCYQSLGRDASGRSTSNTQTTAATCNLGKDDTQKSNCVIGAVKDFVSYFHSDVQATALCNTFTGALQDTCLQTAKAYYQNL